MRFRLSRKRVSTVVSVAGPVDSMTGHLSSGWMCIILIMIKIFSIAEAVDFADNFALKAKLSGVFVPEERHP
jgi:hypothetical protein